MAEKRVSVRLSATGGRQVKAELEGIGTAGKQSFGRLSKEMEAANARLASFSRAARRAVGIAAAPAGINLTNPIVAPLRRTVLAAPVEIERRRQGQGIVTATFRLLDGSNLSGISGAAIYIAIDNSYSMSGAAMNGAIAAVQALIAGLGLTVPPAVRNDICILTWHDAIGDMILRRDADAADFADIADWLAAQGALGSGTDFEVAVGEATTFFAGAGAKRQIILFITDGYLSHDDLARGHQRPRASLRELNSRRIANLNWKKSHDAIFRLCGILLQVRSKPRVPKPLEDQPSCLMKGVAPV